MDRFRNNLATWACNWILKHIATESYRWKIDMLIRQGQFHAGLGGPYITEKEGNDGD